MEMFNRNRSLCLHTKTKSIYFTIPSNLRVRKLIVFVNIDNEPECEILSERGLQMATRSENLNYDLIILKGE